MQETQVPHCLHCALWIKSEGLGENRTLYVDEKILERLPLLMDPDAVNNIPGCPLDSVLKSITWNDKFHAGK